MTGKHRPGGARIPSTHLVAGGIPVPSGTWYPAPRPPWKRGAVIAYSVAGIVAVLGGAALVLGGESGREEGTSAPGTSATTATRALTPTRSPERATPTTPRSTSTTPTPSPTTSAGRPPAGPTTTSAPKTTPKPKDPTREQLAFIGDLDRVGITGDRKQLLGLGETVCVTAKDSGFVSIINAVADRDPALTPENQVFVAVSGIYRLCPQDSPFGSPITAPKELPKGSDGDFLGRLYSMGLNPRAYPNILGNAAAVCEIMTDGQSLLDAEKYLIGANPAINSSNVVAITVTAIQVYCPDRASAS